jgi:hypothetical protein
MIHNKYLITKSKKVIKRRIAVGIQDKNTMDNQTITTTMTEFSEIVLGENRLHESRMTPKGRQII